MMTSLLLASLVAMPRGDGAAAPAKAELPTPADLFALYRDNYQKFKTLTVQWRRSQIYTDAWRARDAEQLAAMATAVAAAEAAGKAEVHTLRQQLNGRQQIGAARAGFLRVDQSYSTDRSRFLMKIAPVGWDLGASAVRPVPGPAPPMKGVPGGREGGAEADPPPMPGDPITEESLRTTYADYQLLAYPEPSRRGFFQVSANGQQGYVSAMIRRQNYSDERNYFPPLGADNPAWGTGSLHPIDEFFREKPEEFRSVRRETIGGREAMLIERRRDVTPAGLSRRVEVLRAWIDPMQGGLPLRIEWDFEPFNDGEPLARDPNRTAYRVLETDEVLAIAGAGFYPAKGRISVFDAVDAAVGDLSAPRVLTEQMTWQAATIRANDPLLATLTTIPIPKGTYYYDEFMGMSLKAGYEAGGEARLPWTLCGLLVAGWGVYGLVALAWKLAAPGRAARVA